MHVPAMPRNAYDFLLFYFFVSASNVRPIRDAEMKIRRKKWASSTIMYMHTKIPSDSTGLNGNIA